MKYAILQHKKYGTYTIIDSDGHKTADYRTIQELQRALNDLRFIDRNLLALEHLLEDDNFKDNWHEIDIVQVPDVVDLILPVLKEKYPETVI